MSDAVPVRVCDLCTPIIDDESARDFENAIKFSMAHPELHKSIFDKYDAVKTDFILQDTIDLERFGRSIEVLSAVAFMVSVWRQPAFPYKEYLQTDHWDRVRGGKRLAESGLKFTGCVTCGSRQGLDVHHRCYDHIGNERESCLILLCRGCHRTFHNHRTVASRGR